MNKSRLNRNVKISMLSAVAALLMYIDIPLWFAPVFYKIDLSEVAVLIGSFAFGPLAGIIIEFLKILIILVIKGTQTGFIGEGANFVIGCFFAFPASLIYYRKKTKKNAIIGIVVGIISMTVIGCIVNAYILIPAYASAFKMPVDAIVAMGNKINTSVDSISDFIILMTAPFNLLKGIVVGIITLVLYKRIRFLLK